MSGYIKNFDALASSGARKDALLIAESAYEAIDTAKVISSVISIEGNILKVKDKSFDISNFDRVRLVGFGKASCVATIALEQKLGKLISGGVVIDKSPKVCQSVEVYEGSHPMPSSKNVEASERIVSLFKDCTERDLVLVVVSGGGSALLCFPASECEQGQNLYNEFLSSGGTIGEINTVRKHISLLKGGGLAKLLYPATVIGLIFCDVPGDAFEDVASGPTYLDRSTKEDAEKILAKYKLEHTYELVETPKEEKFFEKVHNIPMVSNAVAIKAMENMARELGYETKSLGGELYQFPGEVLENFEKSVSNNGVSVGGGEPRLVVTGKGGTGGRNQYTGIVALDYLKEGDVFVAFASDGIDNKSLFAGAIVDIDTKITAQKLGLSDKDALNTLDTEGFLQKTGGLIETGPTGSNVSDLMIYLRKNQ